eukprot:TRINITY_DN25_c0_g1_i6.p1 TRINITY_DN25_c0_g1~~TRINITY_DN25_c0_g1_i6.p1  ORF type:complete len:480 (-),score=96.99 TRINITY_DN25_c0_g1_i6:100-1470(-)
MDNTQEQRTLLEKQQDTLLEKQQEIDQLKEQLKQQDEQLKQQQEKIDQLEERERKAPAPSSVKSDAEFEKKSGCVNLKSPVTMHPVWESMYAAKCPEADEEGRAFTEALGNEWDAALKQGVNELMYSTLLQRRLAKTNLAMHWSHQMTTQTLGKEAAGGHSHIDVIGSFRNATEAAVVVEVKKKDVALKEGRVQALAGMHVLFSQRAHVRGEKIGIIEGPTYRGVAIVESVGNLGAKIRSPSVSMFGVEWKNGMELCYVSLMTDGNWGTALAKLRVYVEAHTNGELDKPSRQRLGRYVACDEKNVVHKVYPPDGDRKIFAARYPDARVRDLGDLKVLEYKKIEGSHWPTTGEHVRLMIDNLTSLHGNNFVHGDIRASNMLFGEHGGFIDFDFGGAHGDRKYPEGYNPNINDGKRHVGAREKQPLEFSHDWFSLAAVMELVEPQDGAQRERWNRFAK